MRTDLKITEFHRALKMKGVSMIPNFASNDPNTIP